MTNYKELSPHLIDAGGGEKYLPLSLLLDFMKKRVTFLDNEIGTPHRDMETTQFHRGSRWELLSFLQAFKDQKLGTERINPPGPNL